MFSRCRVFETKYFDRDQSKPANDELKLEPRSSEVVTSEESRVRSDAYATLVASPVSATHEKSILPRWFQFLHSSRDSSSPQKRHVVYSRRGTAETGRSGYE